MIPHPKSVSASLLSLLRHLMTLPELKIFSLGGGTSLALRFGHRESVDIDLFSEQRFEPQYCIDAVRRSEKDTQIVNRTAGGVCAVIRNTKVDIIEHPYSLLSKTETVDDIRFLSLPDIAAMKINAVTNRGSKKDFSDLRLLHEQGIPLPQALRYFETKYGEAGRFLAIRSLT